MKEIKGNLFDQRHEVLCITTNGFVKGNGHAVMGRGCAQEAANKVPKLPELLGRNLRESGNHVHLLTTVVYRDEGDFTQDWFSFPVKPINAVYQRPEQVVKHMRNRMRPSQLIPGWACVARLDIIEQSARELVGWVNDYGYQSVVIPRPGCGAGELKWEEVREVLAPILDDRFDIITFGG